MQGPRRHFEIWGASTILSIKKLEFWAEIVTNLVNLKVWGCYRTPSIPTNEGPEHMATLSLH